MSFSKHKSRDYSWVQYASDNGQFTVRETVTQDICKCASRADAIAMIERLRRGGRED